MGAPTPTPSPTLSGRHGVGAHPPRRHLPARGPQTELLGDGHRTRDAEIALTQSVRDRPSAPQQERALSERPSDGNDRHAFGGKHDVLRPNDGLVRFLLRLDPLLDSHAQPLSKLKGRASSSDHRRRPRCQLPARTEIPRCPQAGWSRGKVRSRASANDTRRPSRFERVVVEGCTGSTGAYSGVATLHRDPNGETAPR